MKKYRIFRLIIAIIICELAGLIGSIFTSPAIPGWFASLNKPVLNPPSWVFAPVWTILYAMMGVSVWLVWEKLGPAWRKVFKHSNEKGKTAIWLFLLQLTLNILWSILFFGLQMPGLAFIEIVILWFAILGTILAFRPISEKAAWLLMPYLLWVSFASYLNYSFWFLN